jgi:hypothetical protein
MTQAAICASGLRWVARLSPMVRACSRSGSSMPYAQPTATARMAPPLVDPPVSAGMVPACW